MEKGSDVRPEAPPSDNLYVSELPADTSEDTLRKMFGPGVTQCKVLPSRAPGDNCVALVRFASVNQATIVRETLNGAVPPGHTMPVCIRFAGKVDGKGNLVDGKGSGKHRSEPYPGAAGQVYQDAQMMNPGACGGGQIAEAKENPPSDNLYITGLPLGLDNETLKAMFSQYGVVVQCKVLDPRPGATASHALVRFATVDEAVVVKKGLSGYIMQGLSEPLIVEYAIQKDRTMEKGDKGGDKGWKGCWKGGCEKGGCEGMFWDDSAAQWGEGKGWKGDGCWKGDPGCWKGDGGCWKGGPSMPAAWKGVEKGVPAAWEGCGDASAWKGGDASAFKGGEKGVPSWKGGGDASAWKGGGDASAWKGGGDASAWKGGDASAFKGGMGKCVGGKGCMDGGKGCMDGGKGCMDGGKGCMDGGKGVFCSMEDVLQGFSEARCLPGQGHSYDDNALHISGLPKDCDDLHLYKLMAPFGAIPPRGIKAMKNPDGTCKGVGFVNFLDPTSMEAAMQMLNGTLLPDGTVMNVTAKQPGLGKGGGGGGKKGAGLLQPSMQQIG